MPKVEKTCECGRQFATFPSVNQRHCSQACSSRFVPRKRRTGLTVARERCGTGFYQDPTAARKGHGVYCSRGCHNPAQTKPPVVKACAPEGCEAVLTPKPSQARVRYCSREHQALGRIRRPMGRLHNGKPAKRDKYGYVMPREPSRPNTSMKGRQYEHRLVVEAVLGRYLGSEERVDHINGVKDDNSPLNLQVLSARDHSRKTVADLWDGIAAERAELEAYRRRYGPPEEV